MVFKDVLATFRMAGKLDAKTLQKNIVVLLTISLILFISAFLCLAGYRQDVVDKRKRDYEAFLKMQEQQRIWQEQQMQAYMLQQQQIQQQYEQQQQQQPQVLILPEPITEACQPPPQPPPNGGPGGGAAGALSIITTPPSQAEADSAKDAGDTHATPPPTPSAEATLSPTATQRPGTAHKSKDPFHVDSAMTVRPKTPGGKHRPKSPPARQQIDPAAINKAGSPKIKPEEAQLIQMSLPAWARTKSFSDLFFGELGRRHDWFSIAMTYSALHSRPFRVAIITTSALVLMFVNAILYALTFPSDSCVGVATKHDCLSKTYDYDSRKSMCQWYTKEQQCVSVEPSSNNFVATVLIAVISNMVALPLNQIVALIFDRLVLPPIMSRTLRMEKRMERQRRQAELKAIKVRRCTSYMS
jgi:hypothetical protein